MATKIVWECDRCRNTKGVKRFWSSKHKTGCIDYLPTTEHIYEFVEIDLCPSCEEIILPLGSQTMNNMPLDKLRDWVFKNHGRWVR